jgi:hypothetical protein
VKKKYRKQILSIFLSLYTKISSIASGAIPIGSAVAHPIERSRQKRTEGSGNRWYRNKLMNARCMYNWLLFVSKEFQLHCWRNKTSITPIGRYSWEDNLKSYVYWISQTRLQNIILELRHHNKTRMPWYITKVRPQDPSCVARFTHMDALCWYVSVSTMRRKILVDALGTLRMTGTHSL